MADKAGKKKSSAVVTILKFGIGLAMILALAFVVGGVLLPKEHNFSRDITINASRDVIHKDLGDFRKWNDWGPWKDGDPTIQSTYSEKSDQAGSWQEWTGKYPKKGRMEFIKVSEEEGVEYKLSMDDGPYSVGGIKYSDGPEGATKVTWTWNVSANNMLERWFMTVGSGMINDMFDTGLTKLKKRAEASK